MSKANLSIDNDHIRSRERKCDLFKRQIANFDDYVNSYQDSETERVKLRKRIKRLQQEFDKFNEIQNGLDSFEITQQFDDAMAAAEVLQEQLETSASRIPQRSTEIYSPGPSTSSSVPHPVNPPKKEIPTFDGRIEKWASFKNAFVSMVHLNFQLSDIQKLRCLDKHLYGQAAKDIEAFTIGEGNYDAAWKRLVDKYDNNRDLILRHAELLLKTLPMPDDSSQSMRDLANDMCCHVRCLEDLNRNWSDIASDLLTSIAVSRMEKGVRKMWEQRFTNMPQITATFKFLRYKEYRYIPETHRRNNTADSSDMNFNNSRRPPLYPQVFDANSRNFQSQAKKQRFQ